MTVSAAQLVPEVVLRPVREGQAFEAAVEQLATAVRVGTLPVGSQLPPERELASKLGISRVTLREAIAVLRDVGMVCTRRGRAGGTFITYDWADSPLEIGVENIDDSLDFRRIVEGGSAYLAAERTLPETDRSYLMKCLSDVDTASRFLPDGASAHRQADAQLHLAVAASSGNAAVVETVTRLQSQLSLMLARIPVLRRNIEHSNADHEALIDAILSGESDTAREIAEEHCDKTAALIRGFIGSIKEK